MFIKKVFVNGEVKLLKYLYTSIKNASRFFAEIVVSLTPALRQGPLHLFRIVRLYSKLFRVISTKEHYY